MPRIAYSAENTALYHPENGNIFLSDPHWPDEAALAIALSQMAYLRAESSLEQRSRLTVALSSAGFSTLRLFVDNASDTYGFACCNEQGLCVVAFRGTQADRYQDFLTNLQFGFNRWPDSRDCGRVHVGFFNSARSVLLAITEWLEEMAGTRTRLLLCGHSLGGAIANILAVDLRPNALITFGCPRVGDDQFVEYLTHQPQLQITRVVNCCDAVPTVPLPFMGYEHAGDALYINNQGLLIVHPDYSALKRDRAAGRKAYAALVSADPLSCVPVRDLADHAPINYIRSFWS